MLLLESYFHYFRTIFWYTVEFTGYNSKERWKMGKSEFWRKTENWHLEFFICLSLHRVLNAKTKKFEKNCAADGLFGPAVKWAEMAADHENWQNSKISFFPNHGHYVASWLPTWEFLSDHLQSTEHTSLKTAEKSLFLP